MISFDIRNRFTGYVQFTAQIGCSKDASLSVKRGLAVIWAIKNGEEIRNANLYGANLYGANLQGANLYGANLQGACLEGAYLEGAYLEGASLEGAYLYGAYLEGAYLRGACLDGAYLEGAYLEGVHGVNNWIKCIQLETYPITYTAEDMQIGCERHAIAEWRAFDDKRILEMDGKAALKFWRKYKDWIFQTIELCPAKATGAER